MRIILETPPVAATGRLRGTSTTRQGFARFVATLYDAGEVPLMRNGKPYTVATRVADWRRGLPAGEPLITKPPTDVQGPAAAVIPRELLDSLPDDAILIVSWRFGPGGSR